MEYKTTVHLPQTGFPMQANLPANEPKILERWENDHLFAQLRSTAAGRPRFILHDGPPYANGNIHIGHAINKVLKDVIVRSRQMQGFDANYVPGWDCHGLPIEQKVEQALRKEGKEKDAIPPVEFRRRCREFAQEWIAIQRREFQRLGVVGDWENPYLTMDYRFEADIVRELGKFLENGGLAKGFKPVYWCIHDVTALAEAEVEYQDHVSTAIYVKFPLAAVESLADLDPALSGQVAVVIWTTTPWTLPGNLGVSLNPGFDYVGVRIEDPGTHPALSTGEVLILAEGLWESTLAACGLKPEQARVVARVKGSALERRRFRHPYLEQDAIILLGDHVTLEAGSGCVHTAPGHGQDDYVVGMRYGLRVFNPVDDRGCFVAETPEVAGLKVAAANPVVVELLRTRGVLLAESKLTHSYPHCWRCRQPIITRATPQWFISMEQNGLRTKALEAIANTRWIPAWGESRIQNMVANRPDWCVSRQRSWGVPITVISCAGCGENLTDPATIERIALRMEEAGADVWFTEPPAAFLPPGFACPRCGGREFQGERDILDVWFDSGVTHAAVLARREGLSWPADLYLEGSDQHRGWFHSSLLTAVGTRGVAPYKSVLTHGFVVDGSGRKMSKSLGNVVAPESVVTKLGADILRMWVVAEDYSNDIRISQEILNSLVDAYRRIRNTLRFLLGNLAGYSPAAGFDPAALTQLDRWVLSRLAQVNERVVAAYDEYAFHRVYQEIHYFCAVDLGAFYLDILKDRLYCDGREWSERRAAQGVLFTILDSLVRLMAPILCFTADEAWQHLPERAVGSVHLAGFPRVDPAWRAPALEQEMERLRQLRGEVYRLLEAERKEKRIGSFQQATVVIHADAAWRATLCRVAEVARLLLVAGVEVVELSPDTEARSTELTGVALVTGVTGSGKCVRCWNYHSGVGDDAEHPELCPRCCKAVRDAGS